MLLIYCCSCFDAAVMLLQLLCKFYDFKCGTFLHSTEVPAGPVGVFGNLINSNNYFFCIFQTNCKSLPYVLGAGPFSVPVSFRKLGLKKRGYFVILVESEPSLKDSSDARLQIKDYNAQDTVSTGNSKH